MEFISIRAGWHGLECAEPISPRLINNEAVDEINNRDGGEIHFRHDHPPTLFGAIGKGRAMA